MKDESKRFSAGRLISLVRRLGFDQATGVLLEHILRIPNCMASLLQSQKENDMAGMGKYEKRTQFNGPITICLRRKVNSKTERWCVVQLDSLMEETGKSLGLLREP